MKLNTKSKWFLGILGLIIPMAIALIFSYFMLATNKSTFMLATNKSTFFVPSAAMEPTLKLGETVTVDKDAYKDGQVQGGDIIILEAPQTVQEADPKIKQLVKRVIGLPGETIEGRCENSEVQCAVKIYINDELINEDYIVDDPPYNIYAPFGPIVIPEDNVFVMGDNRPRSSDSRQFGPTQTSAIVGKVID